MDLKRSFGLGYILYTESVLPGKMITVWYKKS